MTVRDFITKHTNAGASVGLAAKNAVAELDAKLNPNERTPPRHIPPQTDLIRRWFDTDKTRWLIWFDGGRYDFFEQLYEEYLTGNLQRCYNGGYGYTGDWTQAHLRFDVGDRGLFSHVPLRGFDDAEYDGRRYFAKAPDVDASVSVHERLAELGYRERTTDEDLIVAPDKVNNCVRQYKSGLNGGVIRYIAPHPPFDGLEDLTAESTKTIETQQALANGELTFEELTDAYRETYRKAFRHAVEVLPELDGEIVITADHGTCLYCGQLFHGRRLEMHDHMTHVPWFEVDGVL